MEELTSDPRLVGLRLALADARLRGQPFDTAWSAAVVHALDGTARWVHDIYAVALRDTRPAWESAYERRPTTRLDQLLTELGSYALDGELPRMSEVAA